MGFLEKESSSKLAPASGSLKLATEEMMQGQEMLNKLESLLVDDGAKKLLGEVRCSVARALTALESGEPSEVCQDSDPRSEISSRKRKLETTNKQGKGGCRRRMSSYPSSRVTSKTQEDGFSWRKYGQKEIYGSKCPRSYFRCTHKNDRNCQATRQVQKSEEDPSMYVITYMGDHTCSDASQFLLAPNNHSPCLISFGSSNHCENIEPPPFASFPSLKQELDEEVISNMTPRGSPSDFFMSSEFEGLDMPIPEMAPCNGAVSEHGDEASGLHSSATSLEMEIMPELFNSYVDILNFDHVGFFDN